MIFEDVEAVKKSSPAIFASEPHDVLPICMFGFNQALNAVPGHNCAGLVTSIVFSIPILKHVWSWAGAYSVDKKSMIGFLKKGWSPVLCPGIQFCNLTNRIRSFILSLL